MSTAHRQARLNTEELHQLKQLMGALMALLSFWALASLDVGSAPVIFLGALVAFSALLVPGFIARIPAFTWKLAGPLILLVILADFLLNLPEFIPPLVRMVVLLIIYRVLAPRNQREDLQVILLCLFCLVISGVMTVSLLFAVQILLFTPLAMALLFIICLLDRGKGSKAHVIQWKHFRWSRIMQRVWRVFDLRVAVLSAAMFGLVVTLSTLLFILTPRFDLNQAIPFLEMSTQAQSGFSDEVRLGDVSEIQEDNSVALRIDLPSLDALSEEPYWRMLVLDDYQTGRFRASDSLRTKPLRRFVERRTLNPERSAGFDGNGALWTVYMEGGISRYLPLPGDYGAVRFEKFQDVELVDAVHVVGLDSVGQSVFSYQVQDLRFNRRFAASEADAALISGAEAVPDASSTPGYPMTTLELDLSDRSTAVLRAINERIGAAGQANAAGYSQAATDYLWQRFRYSLAPDVGDFGSGDPIISWLENGSRGHCELFAGAFVLLAREAGYPARMVVGFAGGSWNPVEAYFLVRNREAHAWVEIFDAEAGNWLRVDPTPGRGSSDPEMSMGRDLQIESGWFAWVDSLRIQWYRRVVNFEQEDQVELAIGLKDAVDRFLDSLKQRISALGSSLKDFATNPFDRGDLRLVFGLLLAMAAFYLAWQMRFTVFGLLRPLSRRPRALDPVRLQAARLLRQAQTAGVERTLIRELQALRFGPGRSMKSASPVFREARQAVKRRRQT
jgi:hypothetical protein